VYPTSAEERALQDGNPMPRRRRQPIPTVRSATRNRLDGIKNKIDPGDPVELNVYHMSYEERKERGIVSLPENLKEALDELETSDLMRETLGSSHL
jgi:hypothetical protein